MLILRCVASNAARIEPALLAESGEELGDVNKLNGLAAISGSGGLSVSETSSEDSNSTHDGVLPLLTESTITANIGS